MKKPKAKPRKLSQNKIIAAAFRAAARGHMQPYNFSPPAGHVGGWTSGPFDGRSYDAAKSMAGAFDAIAEVFENLP